MKKKRTDVAVKIGRSKRLGGQISSVLARGLAQIEGVQVRFTQQIQGEVLAQFFVLGKGPGPFGRPGDIHYVAHRVWITAQGGRLLMRYIPPGKTRYTCVDGDNQMRALSTLRRLREK
jgi:hypothetical protein